MSDHSELVAEIASVEKMATQDRLKHAKKRRNQQMKRWANYERQLEKDKSKKGKQSSNQRRHRRQRVRFIHNIMLLEAAARNDVEEVRKLLMAGVSPNITNEDGLTALHQCCIDDSEEMLKLLLEFGADVNSKDSEQWTPLHAAATCGHVHLCKLLIDKGAELLAVNADGNMPYDICEDEVALDYIETEMAKRGVTQEEIDDKRIESEKQMLEDLQKCVAEGREIDREFRDQNGATPLHIAAANGYIDVLEFLLDHHVSMNIRDYDSWLPIHAAACWLQPEVLEILVKNGADLDAKTRNGETAFDLAEDPDVKQKILDLKDELESHRASKSKDHIKGQRRVNPRSASIRRTSMRGEKKPLFKKEAHEEALHFGVISRDDDDDEYPNFNDDKENLPATNIDDVTISIVEDEIDGHSPKPARKIGEPSPETGKEKSPRDSLSGKRDREKEKGSQEKSSENKRHHENSTKDSAHKSSDITKGDNSHRKNHENESQLGKDNNTKSVSPVSEKNERNDSHSQKNSENSQIGNKPREPKPDPRPLNRTQELRHDPYPPRERDSRESSLSPELQNKLNPVARTGSFIKNRDSPRRQSRDQAPRAETGSNSVPGQVRNPSGTPSGTLSDLKKQRSEQHKFGTGLDAQVQNLFLHSLGTGNKYSSGSSQPPQTQTQNKKENAQNGRNIKNNNNNNMSGPTRPPTFLSDSGPLRRFSAPTSHPVIGDDDKFKNNCCVIL